MATRPRTWSNASATADRVTLQRAVFLDRDGVINVDHGYVHKVEHFSFIPGSEAAMARLQAAGWRLVVVTNQSGLARGLYSIDDYQRFTAHLRQQLAERRGRARRAGSRVRTS